MLHKVIQFFKNYYLFGVATLALIVSLVLQLTGQSDIGGWLLGVVASLEALPLLWDMWQELRTGKYGIDILAATAIISAVAFKQFWAAIVIVMMLTGGEALEDYAENRAKTELNALLDKAPKKAHLLRNGQERDVPISEVRVGDKIVIKPGEVVPVDAAIIEGSASFDESSLTGESVPETKDVGSQLLSGSIDMDGAVTVKALRVAADSQYEQIIKLVKSAAGSQAPFVRLADRYSIPFTIVSFIIAIGAWVASGHGIRFLEVLVVATPCPLILAAPIAVISGMSRAAKHGIIVKNGGSLEHLAEARTFVFDKTGTLTRGQLAVDKIKIFGKFKQTEVLGWAAALEQGSSHVLAKAILAAAGKQKIKVPKAKNIKEESGRGLAALVAGRQVLVGRQSYLRQQGVKFPGGKSQYDLSNTATSIAVNGELAGIITFKDELRSESKPTIKILQAMGVAHILMVTGDNQSTAKAIAKKLGLTDVRAEALPSDKLRAIEQLAERPVAFVGDGVNDAPVLTAADIGIALGARGETAASESADMVIMLDDLNRVGQALSIARRTFSIARQSILGGIFLSVVLMLIFSTGHFQPLYGAILQEVVDVIVIFNALRAHLDQKQVA